MLISSAVLNTTQSPHVVAQMSSTLASYFAPRTAYACPMPFVPAVGTAVGTVEGCSAVFHVAVVGQGVVATVGDVVAYGVGPGTENWCQRHAAKNRKDEIPTNVRVELSVDVDEDTLHVTLLVGRYCGCKGRSGDGARTGSSALYAPGMLTVSGLAEPEPPT